MANLEGGPPNCTQGLNNPLSIGLRQERAGARLGAALWVERMIISITATKSSAYHCTPPKMAKVKKTLPSVGNDVEQPDGQPC